MALTRIEKALTGIYPPVAPWFVHSETPDKPVGPDTSTLSPADLDRFNLWYSARMSGDDSLEGGDMTNMTVELAAMIASYQTHFAGPAHKAWAATDAISRQMQWRLAHVDVGNAVDVKGTMPPSLSSGGIGTAAPGLPDIIVSPETMESTGQMVSTGGKSPEVVFGDDGDIVTTGS